MPNARVWIMSLQYLSGRGWALVALGENVGAVCLMLYAEADSSFWLWF